TGTKYLILIHTASLTDTSNNNIKSYFSQFTTKTN
ncbi:hypothetical protein J2756_001381, partial [Methanobacterium aggregans]|nr:hypothetical protein [Methanobacterium aggregans]